MPEILDRILLRTVWHALHVRVGGAPRRPPQGHQGHVARPQELRHVGRHVHGRGDGRRPERDGPRGDLPAAGRVPQDLQLLHELPPVHVRQLLERGRRAAACRARRISATRSCRRRSRTSTRPPGSPSTPRTARTGSNGNGNGHDDGMAAMAWPTSDLMRDAEVLDASEATPADDVGDLGDLEQIDAAARLAALGADRRARPGRAGRRCPDRGARRRGDRRAGAGGSGPGTIPSCQPPRASPASAPVDAGDVDGAGGRRPPTRPAPCSDASGRARASTTRSPPTSASRPPPRPGRSTPVRPPVDWPLPRPWMPPATRPLPKRRPRPSSRASSKRRASWMPRPVEPATAEPPSRARRRATCSRPPPSSPRSRNPPPSRRRSPPPTRARRSSASRAGRRGGRPAGGSRGHRPAADLADRRPRHDPPPSPTVPTADPQWPTEPEWPSQRAAAGLPFLGSAGDPDRRSRVALGGVGPRGRQPSAAAARRDRRRRALRQLRAVTVRHRPVLPSLRDPPGLTPPRGRRSSRTRTQAAP